MLYGGLSLQSVNNKKYYNENERVAKAQIQVNHVITKRRSPAGMISQAIKEVCKVRVICSASESDPHCIGQVCHL